MRNGFAAAGDAPGSWPYQPPAPNGEERTIEGFTATARSAANMSPPACKLGIEDAIPDHSAFSRARNDRFREGDVFRRVFEPFFRSNKQRIVELAARHVLATSYWLREYVEAG